MYTRQQREAILAQFHASGMSMAQAERELPGCPSRVTLGRWLLAERRGELDPPVLPVRGRADDRRRHARYDESTKREALRLLGQGMGPSAVARRLGVSSGSVVSSWARKAGGPGPAGAGREDAGVVAMGDATGGGPLPGGWAEWAADLPDDPAERARAAERKLIELGAVLDVLKAPGPGSLSAEERSRAATLAQARGAALTAACADLGVARSTCYAHRAREGRPDPYAQLRVRVREAFLRSGGRYGSERVWAELRRPRGGLPAVRAKDLAPGDSSSPVVVSEKVVRALMRDMGLVPVTALPSGRRRYSSYAGELCERPANLPLGDDGTHDFGAARPFELIVTDVTEFSLNGFRCYLSPQLDCHDGDPVSWSISAHPDDDLCSSSLAAARLKAGHGFVVHTDGGSCYMSRAWRALCEVGGITRSMSRKGRSPDNARAEGFFGTLKREFFHNRDWTGVGFEEFVRELDAYMVWYRDERLVKALGWRTIREYREEIGVVA